MSSHVRNRALHERFDGRASMVRPSSAFKASASRLPQGKENLAASVVSAGTCYDRVHGDGRQRNLLLAADREPVREGNHHDVDALVRHEEIVEFANRARVGGLVL